MTSTFSEHFSEQPFRLVINLAKQMSGCVSASTHSTVLMALEVVSLAPPDINTT